MLEADPLHGVVQLDVDTEIVRVELELVAVADSAVLAYVHRERGDRSVDAEAPVAIARRVGTVIHGRVGCGVMGHRMHFSSPDTNALYCSRKPPTSKPPTSTVDVNRQPVARRLQGPQRRRAMRR